MSKANSKKRKRGSCYRKITEGSVTVRIYKNAEPTNASGYAYVVAWRTGRGAEGRKRKKFLTEAEAVAEARTMATQLAVGRVEGAGMTRSDRDDLQAARAITNPTPLLAALKEWQRIRELTQGHGIAAAEAWAQRNVGGFERVNVESAVASFLKEKTRLGVQTAKNHNSIFADLKTAFKGQHIDVITTADLKAWLEKREHASTYNTFRKHIVSLWRWAQRQGYLPEGLKTAAERIDAAVEGPQEIGIIRVKAQRDLLEYFRAHHAEYIAPLALAIFCGLRRTEIHKQKWADIHLDRKHLTVSHGKRGTPARRIVPLCDSAVSWLMLCGDRTGDVCDNLAIDRIRDIAITAEFVLPDNCFRHGFISHRVAEVRNVAEVAIEAGNSPDIIFKHYRELVTKDEGEAWFASAPGVLADVIDITKGKAAS